MTKAACECVAQDDIRLFSRGACHVFAVVLQEMKQEEDYELVRVSVLKELEEISLGCRPR